MIASPWSVTVDVGDTPKYVGPASAEDALNKAKLARLEARQFEERDNATDYDWARAQRADRHAQTYALLSIAESLVELTRALREINGMGLRIREGRAS